MSPLSHPKEDRDSRSPSMPKDPLRVTTNDDGNSTPALEQQNQGIADGYTMRAPKPDFQPQSGKPLPTHDTSTPTTTRKTKPQQKNQGTVDSYVIRSSEPGQEPGKPLSVNDTQQPRSQQKHQGTIDGYIMRAPKSKNQQKIGDDLPVDDTPQPRSQQKSQGTMDGNIMRAPKPEQRREAPLPVNDTRKPTRTGGTASQQKNQGTPGGYALRASNPGLQPTATSDNTGHIFQVSNCSEI